MRSFIHAPAFTPVNPAMVTIAGGHTRVVGGSLSGRTCFRLDDRQSQNNDDPLAVLSTTTLSQILEFVEQVPFDAIRFILDAGG